ncbi:MAG TPA: acetyl/propionyl/methylcrotonyl-CoA carboxylase subunit alpha [Steroidobacteraceae bacterium]|nr:acetyl/propionyl/methylcrotonyl-CoA carboxylase subunit alpha [Steroidobacteraceae bacterium]
MRLERLLIANRGEIACRIARTAQRLGIRTVAVHSDADAEALHVRCCDEAQSLGGLTAAESYLRIDAIIEAAHRSGAQAIHPGYGFLSENPHLAERCHSEGILFVGPPAAAMRIMGSKSAAKSLLERAGIALIPGYHGDNQDPGLLRREADRIGYPLLIKASNGGGGRGIRRVDAASDFEAALLSCRREARASFGDDQVLLEKYIQHPRHIEFQIFADTHGQCVHLFERDCSVQRRHQKVLEEAPAPGMTPERRAAMGASAVNAAQAVGYVGAGTVEFIVAPDGTFHFMEMNTRLQVEHPVTEMITGLDLVEWQLRIATGEPLPLHQEQLTFRGHAIEARIAAEDPERGFLPATGTLDYYATPAPSPVVRVDSGVARGSRITPYYDSLLAKLIVWGEDRERALLRLAAALSQVQLVGVATNVDFLGRLVGSPSFVTANLDTALIEREQAVLFAPHEPPPREAWLAAAVMHLLRQDPGRSPTPWDLHDGWRLGKWSRRVLQLRCGEALRRITIQYAASGWHLTLEDHTSVARATPGTGSTLSLQLDGARFEVTVHAQAGAEHVFWRGHHYVFQQIDPMAPAVADEGTTRGLRAPMPGRILQLIATPGTAVRKGAPLLVLEAMKIEHTVLAPSAGLLQGFRVTAGEQVAEGAELVSFEPAAEAKE